MTISENGISEIVTSTKFKFAMGIQNNIKIQKQRAKAD
jgi:hypothetical protein